MSKRKYNNKYPSVTQALAVLRKIGLEVWFKNNTATFCDAQSNKGKLIGGQIHEVIESYIMKRPACVDTEYPIEVTNALNSFILFRRDHPEIEIKFAEISLTSEEHQYNGTMDADIYRNKIQIVGDWKSGECKGKYPAPVIYEESKYQVSAYVKAYNEVFNANIENAIIVSFAKDAVAYGLHEMGKQEIDDHFTNAFLPALKICNHQRKQAWT